jgi:hypothetical protein
MIAMTSKIDRNSEINDLKNIITNIFICYNNLMSKEACANRETDDIVKKNEQQNIDNNYILSMRNNALIVFDKCNNLLMKK